MQKNIKYPLKVPCNPPNSFPEYLFSEKELNSSNIVYKELKNLLSEMNLDKDNYGTILPLQ